MRFRVVKKKQHSGIAKTALSVVKKYRARFFHSPSSESHIRPDRQRRVSSVFTDRLRSELGISKNFAGRAAIDRSERNRSWPPNIQPRFIRLVLTNLLYFARYQYSQGRYATELHAAISSYVGTLLDQWQSQPRKKLVTLTHHTTQGGTNLRIVRQTEIGHLLL